jgi:glycosyltransferase involved in cell wall biosynthesis
MNSAREKLGLSQTKRYILFAGDRNNPRKRFDLAEKILARVKESIPDAELLVASGIAQELMPYYMNASDVMLLVSRHEGSPNVVKEALACNLPIVSANVGDVCQRIGSIDGCIVCDSDEPERFALALSRVLSRNSRIRGRESVMHLDENLLTMKVIAVYEKALTA